MLPEEADLCEELLRSLPGWFGIEAAIAQYRRNLDRMESFVAEADNYRRPLSGLLEWRIRTLRLGGCIRGGRRSGRGELIFRGHGANDEGAGGASVLEIPFGDARSRLHPKHLRRHALDPRTPEVHTYSG